jgi:ATP-binding cassette subfamily B protein/subfamily B ATP-binding cassette protein MsbA
MKFFIDHIVGSVPLAAAFQNTLKLFSVQPTRGVLLLLIAAASLSVFLLSNAVSASITWIWASAGNRTVYDLAEQVFVRLQRQPLTFHKRTPVGELMSRTLEDSRCVNQLLGLLILPAVALLTAVGMLALMIRMNALLTLLALVTGTAMVAVSFSLGKLLRNATRAKRQIEGRFRSYLQQALTGISVVQSFGREEGEQAYLQKFANAHIRSQQRVTLLGSLNGLCTGLVTTLTSSLILWLVARNVIAGHITLGSGLIFVSYFQSLQAQMTILAGLYPALQMISANEDRVVQVLDTVPKIQPAAGEAVMPPIRGHVRFENVTAGYSRERPVLENISFEVRACETIGIVGPTGAGKTTLVNLIPRFEDPWEGRVLIDGQDVRSVSVRSLREQVSMVLQDSFLFPVSVAENIAYGRPDARREEIEEAARLASAHEFIAALPEGYDTVIGERGASLSGGMRQRLAIARALLKKSPIFILDETTSALDAETEFRIVSALRQFQSRCTIFIIAHRLSTVQHADRIFVVKDRTISESGNHQELLSGGGYYANLYQLHTTALKRPAPAVAPA